MPVPRVHSTLRPAALAALLVLSTGAAACSRDAGAEPKGGAPGGPGGGRNSSVTLAASDVGTPRRMALEDAIPVTGTLAPLERSEVRARLEGDLVGVYVREGEAVGAGQMLARFEAGDQAGEQRSAQAEAASVRTVLRTAQWNLEQTRELHEQGAVPERDVRLAEQEVAAARARVAAAESRVQTSGNQLGDTRVLAPGAGVVEKRAVNPGEHVNRGQSMFTLVSSGVLELAAAVPERSAPGVRVGQAVRFTADGRSFEGRVARIGPSVDPASRAVTVYVQVPNRDGTLKAGTFASGRIVARVVPDALVIPASAVHEGGEGSTERIVYRIRGDELETVPVTLGLADEAQGVVQVSGGLGEADRIVVGNVGMLGKGMKVRMAGAGGRPKAR